MGIKTLSLFHGVGGLTSNSDLELVAVSEYERNIFLTADAFHFKKTSKRLKNLGDVTKVSRADIDELGKIDLVVATPPCQAYSIGGKRRSRGDSRGLLWNYAIDIINHLYPKVVIVENVKNLINIEDGEVLFWYLSSLSNLGYVVDFDVLNAKNFGLSQDRERFFMIAIRRDLYEKQNRSHGGEHKKEVDKQRGKTESEGPSSFQSSYGEYLREKRSLRDRLKNASFRKDSGESVSQKDRGFDERFSQEELPSGEDQKRIIAFSKSHRDFHIDVRTHLDKKVNTLTTGNGCNHQSTGNYIYCKGKFHLLTPEQGELFMGWPYQMTAHRFESEKSNLLTINSDRLRFKMIGNGVCGGILDEILKNLKKLGFL